jgi:hypothetical protein
MSSAPAHRKPPDSLNRSFILVATNISMDPLSVAASIVGILAVAAKVVEVLSPALTVLKDIPSNAKAITSETKNLITILSALQKLLDDLDSIPQKRRQLIQLDQLVASFTDGVLLFSELENLVNKVDLTNNKLWSKVHDLDFHFLLVRIQYFKSSVSLMLEILQ